MPMVLLDVSIASLAERAFVDALTAMSPATLVTIPAGDDATLDAVRGLGARDRRDEEGDGDGVGRHDGRPVALGEVRDVLARELTILAERPPPTGTGASSSARSSRRWGRPFASGLDQSRVAGFHDVRGHAGGDARERAAEVLARARAEDERVVREVHRHGLRHAHPLARARVPS